MIVTIKKEIWEVLASISTKLIFTALKPLGRVCWSVWSLLKGEPFCYVSCSIICSCVFVSSKRNTEAALRMVWGLGQCLMKYRTSLCRDLLNFILLSEGITFKTTKCRCKGAQFRQGNIKGIPKKSLLQSQLYSPAWLWRNICYIWNCKQKEGLLYAQHSIVSSLGFWQGLFTFC